MYERQEIPFMTTIHVVRSGSQYSVDKLQFKDMAGLAVYLKMRDITQKNILNAIELLARDGQYTIKQK
jgi:hypothetical protein